MNRRAPVRSVLAERRMFAGGGMLPISTPMQNTMDQGQPSGILASSTPLIDAVSQEILAPITGGAMPMAQGGAVVDTQPAYVFQEGGIAQFDNGGYADMAERLRRGITTTSEYADLTPRTGAESLTYVPHNITRDFNIENLLSEAWSPTEVTGESKGLDYLDTVLSENLGTVSEDVERIFPLKSFPGYTDFMNRFEGYDPEELSRIQQFGLNILAKSEEAFDQIGTASGPQIEAAFDWMGDAAFNKATYPELRTLMRLKLSRPDLAEDIDRIGEELLQNKEKPYKIKSYISTDEALKDLPNNPLAQAVTARLQQPFTEEAERRRGQLLGSEDLSPFVQKINELTASEELMQQEDAMLRKIRPPSGGTSIAEQEASRQDPFSFAPSLDRPDSDSDEKVPLPVKKPDPDKLEADAEVVSDEKVPLPVKKPDPDKPIDENQQDAAAQVRAEFAADTSDDQKDAQNSLQKYIEEFRSAVPDYEGKSDWEKGMDIVKMGMAIAAGEDQNAIKNIAKGVMATIDNFTSDDKERRAYKRQIDLSAAKYGLQALNKDRATLEALSREKRSLFGTVFRVKKGQSFEYNGKRYGEDDTVIFRRGDIQDGTAPLNLVDTEDFSIESIKASVKKLEKRLAGQLDSIKAVSESPKSFSPDRERYMDAVSQVKGNISIQNLLKEAMVPLAAGEVTGGFNSLKAFGRKIENFFGIELPKEIASAEPERYRFLVNQAIQKNITALLNEGNRTISDADRKRAETIGGLYADHLLAPSVESQEKLERTLIAFNQSLDRNSEDMLRRMAALEDTWDGTISKSMRPKDYGEILRQQRGSLASTVVATPGAARKVKWTDIIAIDPDTNTMSYKPDWYEASQ